MNETLEMTTKLNTINRQLEQTQVINNAQNQENDVLKLEVKALEGRLKVNKKKNELLIEEKKKWVDGSK